MVQIVFCMFGRGVTICIETQQTQIDVKKIAIKGSAGEYHSGYREKTEFKSGYII